MLLSSCTSRIKDGGSVVNNLGFIKIIKWHSLSGKNYTESHIFPASLFPLDYYDMKEERDFDRLLKSARLQASEKTQGYAELRFPNMDKPSNNKFYDDYLKRGKKTNYYLLNRMLCDTPTMFFIQDIATPLTDGDIAFMLLYDINCHDKIENCGKKLFPAENFKQNNFTYRTLFDYLHASRENRLYVAKQMLENFIDDDWLKKCSGYILESNEE